MITRSRIDLLKTGDTQKNHIPFFDEMIKLVDQRNAVDVVHIDFCEAFNTVKHCIHLDKPGKNVTTKQPYKI